MKPENKAWLALFRPLTFAAKDGFRNIGRVRDLGQSLRRAALTLAGELEGEASVRLGELAIQLEGFEEASAAQQCRLVALGLRLCAMVRPQLDAGAPQPDKPLAPAGGQEGGPPPYPQPLTVLRGVGPVLARRLLSRGLHTVEDLIFLLPVSYKDQRLSVPLADVGEGAALTTTGVVVGVRQRTSRRPRGRVLEVALAPEAGLAPQLWAVWFRAHPGLLDRFARDQIVRLSGTVRRYRERLQMAHPDFQILAAGSEDPGGPIRRRYPQVEGVQPGRLAELCRQACLRFANQVPDGIPASVAARLSLISQAEALRTLHLAMDADRLPRGEELDLLQQGEHQAHRRLALEELFSLQLAVALRRAQWGRRRALPCTISAGGRQALRGCLPFDLTRAQQRVLDEILQDMSRDRPMHRLLQGDVGSGKTAVAFGAAWAAMERGAQAALMAPTEILARQHFEVLDPWCRALGRRAALLTAATPRAVRQSLLALADGGMVHLLVGTHALLSPQVQVPDLALAVVDEQHRFGVMQRARLRDRGADCPLPHLLVMTATPIPRSMALTLYGDLDLSLLDERPPGRSPPQTMIFAGKRRHEAYDLVRSQLEAGQQAFVVCPLVEESEKVQAADAVSKAAELQARLEGFSVGLVHGRLLAAERHRVMQAFRSRALDLLVATTVVEVGIDVPEANVMVIEHADRFGLAQLHQLRGRVGRGEGESFCLLFSDALPESVAGRRLTVMERTTDGFEIAEADLALRGPGEVFGTRQAGLPRFRFADVQRHMELLSLARQAAWEVVESDPTLTRPENREAQEVMLRRWRHLPLVGEEAG